MSELATDTTMCVWGEVPDDNDCFNDWHAFVECINCGKLSDYCIYEKSADKQVRVCLGADTAI